MDCYNTPDKGIQSIKKSQWAVSIFRDEDLLKKENTLVSF